MSKKDIEAVLLGIFNPDKPPAFRKDSGIIKAIEQINRETENNYKVTDFVDLKAIVDVQKKYSIAIVPTIVVFDDGEEVKRYQADLSFKMAATREEVQEYIDELIMSKF